MKNLRRGVAGFKMQHLIQSMRLQQAVLSIFTFFCFMSTCYADEKVDESPSTFIKAWAATFNENNPEKHTEFYDRSKETEILVSSGLRTKSFEAIQKAYQDDQKQLRYSDSTVNKISTRVLGDTAIVTFEHQFKLQFLADDSRWQVHIRTTSVLHRVDNKWKIVHEHSSSIGGIERMTKLKDELSDMKQGNDRPFTSQAFSMNAGCDAISDELKRLDLPHTFILDGQNSKDGETQWSDSTSGLSYHPIGQNDAGDKAQ